MLQLPWQLRTREWLDQTIPNRLLAVEQHGSDDTIYIADTPARMKGAIMDVFKARYEDGYYDDDELAALEEYDDVHEVALYLVSRRKFESERLDIVQGIVIEA